MVKSIAHFVSSSKNSLCGLVSTFKNEMAFRQEVLLVIPHVVVLWLAHFPLWAVLLLSSLLAVVFISELLNTGIECVVDIASPGYHELAKRAKDAASAAVGLSLLVYFVSWIVLLVDFCRQSSANASSTLDAFNQIVYNTLR